MGVPAMTVSAELRAIDLGEVPAPAGTPLDKTAAGAVAGGAVVAFGAEVSAQHRQDVVQSLLFAQLAASARADRHTRWADWYEELGKVVERIGWVRGSGSQATQWVASGPFPFTAPVRACFAEQAGEMARMRVTDVLTALSADRAAQVAFAQMASSGALGNFQVALADEDEDTVRLRLVQCVFQAPEHLMSLVTAPLPAGTRFWTRFADLVLDERAYAAGRSTIARRLGDRGATMVAPLAPPAIPDVADAGDPDGMESGLGYDPADPFGDLATGAGPEQGRTGVSAWVPPVVENLLIDEPGATIRVTEMLTVDPDRLFISLETPNHITWWKSITLYTVRVPAGQDPEQFIRGVQFLLRRTEPRGLSENTAALTDPNAVRIGRIETKDLTHRATYQVEPWMLDGNELHLEFHKGGFMGIAAYIPVEFHLRGGKGKHYTFTWSRD